MSRACEAPVIVDSHTHVVSPDTDRYPLAARSGVSRSSGPDRSWWAGGHGAEALVAAMDEAGVHRAVVVQAVGPYGYDCRYAIDAVAAFPQRLALVVAVDMDGPDPAGALGSLNELAVAAAVRVRGVRVFGVDGTPPVWLTDGRAAAVWTAAAELGCTVVATLFMSDLPALRPVVEAEPGVPVAVDHAGFPDLTAGSSDAGLAPLLELADLDPIHVKISSHVLLEARTAGDPADLVDRLVDAFGPTRLTWGSDCPQTAGLTYPGMLDLARQAVRRLPAPAACAVLGDTASRLWWPSASPPPGTP